MDGQFEQRVAPGLSGDPHFKQKLIAGGSNGSLARVTG
jgi:hypothetical protein